MLPSAMNAQNNYWDYYSVISKDLLQYQKYPQLRVVNAQKIYCFNYSNVIEAAKSY